jgi:hypothetical protein
VTAGVLLFLTILLTAVLWRLKKAQVIPNHAFGTRRNMAAGGDEIAGFGMEIRKLNKLIKGESRARRGMQQLGGG